MAKDQGQSGRRHNRGGNSGNAWTSVSVKNPVARAILGECTIATDPANGVNCLGVSKSDNPKQVHMLRRAGGLLSVMPIDKAELRTFIAAAKAGDFDDLVAAA